MGSIPQRNFKMFAWLCGEKAASNVRLITTMWDKEGDVLDDKGKKAIEVFEDREKQLRESYWKGMLDSQATMCRYSNDPTTAWLAIQPLLSQEREKPSLWIQQELVDHHLRLHETKAGKMVYGNVNGFLDTERQKVDMMKRRAAANPHLLKQVEASEREYAALLAEAKAEKKKIGVGMKVLLMFKKKPKVRLTPLLYFFVSTIYRARSKCNFSFACLPNILSPVRFFELIKCIFETQPEVLPVFTGSRTLKTWTVTTVY